MLGAEDSLTRRQTILRILASLALAFAYVWLAGPASPLQDDPIQDYSLARACVDAQACQAHGTSVVGLQQGRLLLVLLEACLRIGIHPQTQHLLVIATCAVAVVLLAELARSLASPHAGIIAGALAAWILPLASGHPLLWNPTLATLPLALMTVSCIQLARTEHVAWALGIGLGLVFAYHGHIVNLVAWPVAAFIVGIVTRKRASQALVIVGPALGLLAFDTATFLNNCAMVLRSGYGLVFPLVVIIAFVVGTRLREPWLARPEAQRPILVLLALGLPLIIALGLGSWIADMPLEGRYFAAAAPTLVVLSAVAVEKAVPRVRPILAVCALVFVTLRLEPRPRLSRMWTFADLERLDASLYTLEGLLLAELGSMIRAPDGQNLVNGARSFGPQTSVRLSLGRTLRLVPIPLSACNSLEAPWHCVRLGPIARAAWSINPTPWIDPTRFEACAVHFDTIEGGPLCVPVEVESPRHERAPGYPRILEDQRLAQTRAIETFVQHLHVNAGEGGYRWVVLARDWKLRGARGIEAETEGPSLFGRTTLRIRAEPGTQGTLTIERFADGGYALPATPSIVVELGPEDEALLEAIRAENN